MEDLDLLDDKVQTESKRPVFLTVLCILTFVGAGFGIIAALIGMLAFGTLEDSTAELNDLGGPVDFGNAYRWMKISYLLSLAGSVLCLVGALFMWRLKKFGFFIYVPGQVLPLIGSFLTVNSMFGGGILAGFGMITIVFSALFPLAFIIMYGLNLKYMTR